VGNAPERSDVAVGGRATAGAGSPRLRLLSDLLIEGRANPRDAQPRFASLALAGVGAGFAPGPRTWLDLVLSAGGHMVQVRDSFRPGWVGDMRPTYAGRAVLSFRPATFGQRTTVSPVIGLSLGALWSARIRDPVRGVAWGGFAPLVALSIGGEITLPAPGVDPAMR
jgi:hypothetical protein